ncbi:MAG: hypothetical protein AAFU78_06840 [Cyanobacteria bacterium J06633_2]
MQVLLINYANHCFYKSQKLNSKTGRAVGGFDKIISYSPKNIGKSFYEKNKKILAQRRGAGYWLWKPYLMKKSLELLNDGDFLFYCDSGSYFIQPITPLIEISLNNGQDIIPFGSPYCKEKTWTKRDAFILMDCDSPEYFESHQRLASFVLFKKSDYTMTFLEDYLHFAQDERIITDIENQCGLPNYPGFKENRHDQSIFSLLTKKYELDDYRNPSQYGNSCKEFYSNSQYEQLINHSRERQTPLHQRVAKKVRKSLAKHSNSGA